MNKEITFNNFSILGFQDSINCCDRCGKSDLKGTWTIETDLGETYHLGSSCVNFVWQMGDREEGKPKLTTISLKNKMVEDRLKREQEALTEIKKIGIAKTYYRLRRQRQQYWFKDYELLDKYKEKFQPIKAEFAKKYHVNPDIFM